MSLRVPRNQWRYYRKRGLKEVSTRSRSSHDPLVMYTGICFPPLREDSPLLWLFLPSPRIVRAATYHRSPDPLSLKGKSIRTEVSVKDHSMLGVHWASPHFSMVNYRGIKMPANRLASTRMAWRNFLFVSIPSPPSPLSVWSCGWYLESEKWHVSQPPSLDRARLSGFLMRPFKLAHSRTALQRHWATHINSC